MVDILLTIILPHLAYIVFGYPLFQLALALDFIESLAPTFFVYDTSFIYGVSNLTSNFYVLSNIYLVHDKCFCVPQCLLIRLVFQCKTNNTCNLLVFFHLLGLKDLHY